MVTMATPLPNGKYRLVITLEETDYQELCQAAKWLGLTRADVAKLRIKGIETTRRAA